MFGFLNLFSINMILTGSESTEIDIINNDDTDIILLISQVLLLMVKILQN